MNKLEELEKQVELYEKNIESQQQSLETLKRELERLKAEKEKLYTVGLANGPILIKDPEFNTFQLCKATKEQIEGYKYKLTKSEIESVDPRLMQFAEEVE